MTRLLWLLAAPLAVRAAVEFNRDIRPILSDRCFHCHGPDSVNRKANLRLDTEAGLKTKLPDILARIATDNKARRMPPAYTGAGLNEREIAALKQWAAEGARWQKHWSLIPPAKPTARNIDELINARLAGLTPNAEADRRTLLRRVSFDLTGLPPTPEEVEAFVADPAPSAYEKVVDRLLASPRYGERLAARWLDAARYADTNGYQTDAERFMWRWRDWVIQAFNRNQPFDQFTVEQLAGDLLPNATRDQKIATGFNRNHRANGEGGSLDAEFLVEYAIDRVETTSTVWLGLTMGCTRCHDHKYDPFTQKEFYSLYAFFNNIPEKGKVFKYGNSPPLIPAPTPIQDQQLGEHESRVAKAQARFEKANAAKAVRPPAPDWAPTQALLKTFRENKLPVEAGNVGAFGFYDRFTLSAWIKPAALDGAIVSKAIDKEEATGYGLYLKNGKVQANLIQRWLDDCLRVETEAAIAKDAWTHVAITYDGTRVADGIKIYVNGVPQKLVYIVDDLNQSFDTKEPFRIGAGHGQRFNGEIGEVRIYGDVLTAEEAAALGTKQATAYKNEMAFRETTGPAELRAAWAELRAATKARESFMASLPTVMVMQENPTPKQAFLLQRGQYDRPGDPVSRALPASLGSLGSGPIDRLSLARWIVSRDNPLTARVTVNRFWQMLFGTGLVKTVEDFGSQGEWPSHPELLDWLAVDFMENGWNVKRLLKTIVMSQAYRRDSRVTPELLQRDPENRLLARGPRVRLAPEMVRDQALLASGLLVEKLGGPSVKPYQPAGLWKELSGGADYVRDHGENLYRRSMYTFWKRASPPPGMMTFDSAGREACTVRESRTNTPMQALTLMNDETYLEAARKLAERMLREGGASARQRIDRGFRLVLGRPVSDQEATVLERSWARQIDRFRSSPADAAKLLSQGESKRDDKLDPTDLASATMVASAILNLDEAVTKQ